MSAFLLYYKGNRVNEEQMRGVEDIEKILHSELAARLGVEKEQGDGAEPVILYASVGKRERKRSDRRCENADRLCVKLLEDSGRLTVGLRRGEERREDGEHTARRAVVEVEKLVT